MADARLDVGEIYEPLPSRSLASGDDCFLAWNGVLSPRGERTHSLSLYGAVFSTTYWKQLFGLPVVWKKPAPWPTIARAFPLEPASV
jgi:hypothetical protein